MKVNQANNLKEKLQDKKNINRIIWELEELAGFKFTKNGILAGQAVASKIYELLKIDSVINPVINDIDLFIFISPYSFTVNENKINSTASRTLGFGQYSDDYAQINFFFEKKLFTILGTTRRGLLNKVFVSLNHRELGIYIDQNDLNTKKRKLKTIIDSFDINSAQVGIDLQTKEIYFTDEFIEFLVTKQMKIVNYMTPVHSLIRLERKAKELGVFTNIEDELLSVWGMSQILNSLLMFEKRIGDNLFTLLDFFPNKNEPDLKKIKRYLNLFQGRPVFFGKKHLQQFENQCYENKKFFEVKNIDEIMNTKTQTELYTLLTTENGLKTVEQKLEYLNKIYFSKKEYKGNLRNLLNISNSLIENPQKILFDIKDFYGADRKTSFKDMFKTNVFQMLELKNEKEYTIKSFFNYTKSVISSLSDFYKKAKYNKKNKTYFFIEKASNDSKKTKEIINIPFLSTNLLERKISFEECLAFLYENIRNAEKKPDIVYNMARQIHKEFKNHPTKIYLNFLYSFVNESLNDSLKLFNNFFGSFSELVRNLIIGKIEEKIMYGIEESLFESFKQFMELSPEELKAIEKDLTKEMLTKLKEDAFFYEDNKIRIEELITKKALIKEGNEMKHCVGGYSRTVQKGQSIILKVSGKIRATIELSPLRERTNHLPKTINSYIIEKNNKKYVKEYALVQFKGFKNKTNWDFKETENILEIINQKYKILPLLPNIDTGDIILEKDDNSKRMIIKEEYISS